MAAIETTVAVFLEYSDLSSDDQHDILNSAIEEKGASVVIDAVADIHGTPAVMASLDLDDVVAHFGTDLLSHFDARELVEYAFVQDQEEACKEMENLLGGL